MNTEILSSIYEYQNPLQFILDRIAAMRRQDSTLSVRALAKRMGMPSHALLVMLLQGKRPLRVKHSSSIAKGLGLSSSEQLYLQALIQFDGASDLEEKKLCSLWLQELHPQTPVRSKILDQFELVSNWVHLALMALGENKDFDPKPEALAKRFRNKVSAEEIRAALERLKSLGLIQFDVEGRFHPTYNRVTTTDDVANVGARKFHREAMRLAAESLDEVALTNREFQSSLTRLPKDKLPLAKDMIRKFRAQFENAMGSASGEEVYQINIQFFQLTESPEREIGRVAEDEGVAPEWNTTQQGEIP